MKSDRPVDLNTATHAEVDLTRERDHSQHAALKHPPTEMQRRRFDAALRGGRAGAAQQPSANGAGGRRPSTSGLPKPNERGTMPSPGFGQGLSDADQASDDADAAQQSDGSDEASELNFGFVPLLRHRSGEGETRDNPGGQGGHDENASESGDESGVSARVMQGVALPVPSMLLARQIVRRETVDSQTHDIVHDLAEQVGQVVQSMRVSVDPNDRRAVELDLKPSVISDVTVRIEEEDGRWCVTFVCRREPPRERLCEVAPVFADTLAARLHRDVAVRVRTDDDEDPRLLEVRGQA